MFRSIRWRIALTFVALILVCMGGLSAYLLQFARSNYLNNLNTQLIAQAKLIGDASQPYFTSGQIKSIDSLVKRLGSTIDARITVIDKNGIVLGDSEKDPITMENHSNRPEVIDALSQGCLLYTSDAADYSV